MKGMTEAILTKEPTMTNSTPLPLRHDTILGVCEAIGRDFGFNPLYLRLAFIVPLFLQPYATVAAYFLLGALVGLVHLVAPNRQVEQGENSAPAFGLEAKADEPLPIAA